MTVAGNPEWKDACAVIGEIALLYTALDHQVNHIVIEVMSLAPSPLLEPVVATLDTRQKIEMLKAHAKHIRQKDWKKAVQTHADRMERIARIRNAACHTPLVPKSKGGFEFAPAAASKLLKSITIIDREKYTSDRLTLEQVREAIPVAEKTLGGGENILDNFRKLRTEMARRKLISAK
ncbi:hypothetical protein [Bradyrhizobium erythrophlei]|uniref:Cthe-2314-like HEPN domain-containing protein n=1 Tax=Bradyrhizobium erythrophlei TaxID=1437360 RepID=A0A1M5JZW3_9BRAD|nr:hypothetical protein [Bradyrhizobium erythrophlei]SHG45925.1 hypothetical protein SAMN05443248_1628 [Bradyrhizobium erythrophlei]